MIAQLQIFGSRYPGSPACFRWIADLRGRNYESQPDAIDVELSSGDRMSIPFVASEADTYISSCVPIARLGDGERITARFRAELAGAPVDETQVFLRAAPADDGFVDIPGAVVPAAP